MEANVTSGSVQDIIESVESIDFKDKRFLFQGVYSEGVKAGEAIIERVKERDAKVFWSASKKTDYVVLNLNGDYQHKLKRLIQNKEDGYKFKFISQENLIRILDELDEVDSVITDEERSNCKDLANNEVLKLKQRYAIEKADNYTQVSKENSDVNIEQIKKLAKDKYKTSITKLLQREGIIKTSEEKINEITIALKPRYANNKAEKLSEVISNNKDIVDISRINEYTQDVYQKTAKQYLIDIGVIVEVDNTETVPTSEKLDAVITQLKKKYKDHKATSLTEVINDNKELGVTSVNAWTRELFNITAKTFFVEQGIIEEPINISRTAVLFQPKDEPQKVEITRQNDLFEPAVAVSQAKATEILRQLKNTYFYNMATSVNQIIRDNRHLDIPGLIKWIEETQPEPIDIFLCKKGIVKRSTDQSMIIRGDDLAYKQEIEISSFEDEKGHISAIDELIGIIEGVNYDGIVNTLEVKKLSEWLDKNAVLLQNTKYEVFLDELREILSDGRIDDEERELLIKRSYGFKSDIDDVERCLITLVGILDGIICDMAIADAEIIHLDEWIADNDHLQGIPIYDRVKEVIGNILEDDIISEEEKNYFLTYISQIVSSNKERKIGKREDVSFESSTLASLIESILKEKDGLKAREISALIPGTKTIDINKALYAKDNRELFVQSDDYEWHIKSVFEGLNENELEVLKQIVSEDFEDIKLIKQQFYKRIENANIGKINEDNLKRIGYRISGNVAYKGGVESLGWFLTDYVCSRPLCDLSDKEFLFKNAQASITINRLKERHKIIEYDTHRYVSAWKLDEIGITREIIDDFCNEAIAFAKGEYFNNHFLRVNGFSHLLYEYGFEQKFFESVLRANRSCSAVQINGTYVFVRGNKARGIPDIVENEIDKEKSIDIYDMIDFFREQYGVSIGKQKLVNRLSEADVYYSDTMETIYADYDLFFEEV